MSVRTPPGSSVNKVQLYPTTSRRSLIRDTLATYSPAQSIDPAAAAGATAVSVSVARVMVVDDSLLMVKKLEVMLHRMGHQVVRSVHTGSAAVYAYGECQPDVVTMDVARPDMDGIEASRRILRAFPKARIVVVTSHGQETKVRDAIKAGVFGYVFKPVQEEKLAEHVRRALRR